MLTNTEFPEARSAAFSVFKSYAILYVATSPVFWKPTPALTQ